MKFLVIALVAGLCAVAFFGVAYSIADIMVRLFGWFGR